MNREISLKNVLKHIMTKDELDTFLSYQISEDDISFLKQVAKVALDVVPINAFNCAMLSGVLGAMIIDHSKIPVSVMCGHLDYFSKRLFNCDKPFPSSIDKKVIDEIWNGHCWIDI